MEVLVEVDRNKFFFSKCWMCFRSVQKTIYFIFPLISSKNTYKLKVWSFRRLHLFVFFKDWLINFFKQSLWSLIVKCPRCPILSSCEILCNIVCCVFVCWCNHVKVVKSWFAHTDCFYQFLIFLLKFFLFVFCHRCVNQITLINTYYQ